MRDICVEVRRATAEDRSEWVRLRAALWDYAEPDQLEEELEEHLRNPSLGAFVIDRGNGKLGGFLETSIRPWAEGCTTANVGYIEGWFVDDDLRGQGWGRMLVEVAETWARERGCREMGSDSWIDNLDGRAAHVALGYEERMTAVHFRKLL
jgi:aminoglycoside 6'-N-acetyltransferase I